MPLTLVVMAAGIGSRYGGLKQVDPVGPNGETLLDYSIFDALRSGFERVVFVIRKEIEAAFGPVAAPYEARLELGFAFQEPEVGSEGFVIPAARAKPWGTGHAVLAAGGLVTAPFAVINADDFYGASAFDALAGFLRQRRGASPVDDYAMVAHRLGSTLSDHGPVARGVCRTRDGLLEGIEEVTGIERSADRIVAPAGSGVRSFTGDEPVSLNTWAFTPSVFAHLRRRFGRFLRERGHDPDAEFYLPAAVAELIDEGRARVHVLRCEAAWFGVTYREDRPGVARSISRLVAEGEYPSPLWPR